MATRNIERRPVQSPTFPIMARVPWATIDALDAMANAAGISRSAMARRILERAVSEYEPDPVPSE
jgi:hypothetical protein